MPRVLVAEDDPALGDPLVRMLAREGYEVDLVTDGVSALKAARSSELDLMVLDLGLPRMSGLDVCRALRDVGSHLPILVLTARTAEVDIVVALDAGADDYVTKPFRTSELLARVRALLRRRTPSGSVDPNELVTAGAIVLDPGARTVTAAGAIVTLTPKEFELLELLMRRRGRVVTRQSIMRDVWHTDWVGQSKTLDMHISTLRRKLGRSGRLIVTLRGVGFRIDEKA